MDTPAMQRHTSHTDVSASSPAPTHAVNKSQSSPVLTVPDPFSLYTSPPTYTGPGLLSVLKLMAGTALVLVQSAVRLVVTFMESWLRLLFFLLENLLRNVQGSSVLRGVGLVILWILQTLLYVTVEAATSLPFPVLIVYVLVLMYWFNLLAVFILYLLDWTLWLGRWVMTMVKV